MQQTEGHAACYVKCAHCSAKIPLTEAHAVVAPWALTQASCPHLMCADCAVAGCPVCGYDSSHVVAVGVGECPGCRANGNFLHVACPQCIGDIADTARGRSVPIADCVRTGWPALAALSGQCVAIGDRAELPTTMALVVCGVRTTLAADECITPNGLLVPVTQYLSRLVASSDAAVTVSRTVATERQITEAFAVFACTGAAIARTGPFTIHAVITAQRTLPPPGMYSEINLLRVDPDTLGAAWRKGRIRRHITGLYEIL